MLPAIGTRVVHKEDHKKLTGPVWEVNKHYPKENNEPGIGLAPAKHKLNQGIIPGRIVPLDEYKKDYVQL